MELEYSILSCLLQDPKLHDRGGVTEKDFENQECKSIFSEMKTMIKRGLNPAFQVVINEMPDKFDILSRILETEPTPTFYNDFVKQIKERSTKRNLRIFGELVSKNQDLKEAQMYLDKILKAQFSGEQVLSGKELVKYYQDQLLDKQANTPIKTGLPTFDEKCGLYQGEILTIAALTSMGKSALGMTMALNAAEGGRNVLFISAEMSQRRLIDRMYSRFSGVDNTVFKKGEPKKEILKIGNDNVLDLGERFKLVRPINPTSESIISAAYREEFKDGIDLIVIDHFHALSDSEQKGESEALKFDRIMRGLNNLANEINCGIILLAQFNNTGFIGKRPTLASLKGSSSIGQFSTSVCVLHRESRDSSDGVLYTDKARNGETGDMNIKYEGKLTTFYEKTKLDNYLNQNGKTN